VSAEISRLGSRAPNYIDNFSDFRRIKDRLDDVPLPDGDDGQEQGARESGDDRPAGTPPDAPSTRFQTYRGSAIEFEYPSNWTARASEGTVTAAPSGGVLNNGSLAYGILISEFEPVRDRRGNVAIEDATDQLIANLRESNPSMRIGQGYRSGRLDGRQALSVGMVLDSPLGGPERAWLISTFGPDGNLYYLIGVSPEADYDRYQPVLQRIFESVDLR
jgi:hypothetical protein